MQQKYIGYVYIVTCTITGEKYIGAHRSTKINDNYFGSGDLITAALKKYGKKAFTKKIIGWASSVQELAALEYKTITEMNAIDDPMYFNVSPTSLSVDQRLINTQEYINANMRKQKPEHIPDITNNNYGHKWPEERKQALSELRKKNGRSAGKNNAMYGKKDERAINGQIVCMRKLDGTLEKVFATKQLAMKYLFLKGHMQFNRAIANRLPFKGRLWTQNDADKLKVDPAVDLNDFRKGEISETSKDN